MKTSKYTIEELKKRLEDSAYDGGALVDASIDYLQDVHDNKVELVDPSNPAILLVEMMAVNTSGAIGHSDNNLSNRYVSLATNFEQLYPHMSDEDHRDIFALHGKIIFNIMVPVANLLKRSIPDSTNTYRYVSIPKDTEVRVADMIYTFRDRIEIRTFVSDAIKVVRIDEGDNDISSYTVDNNVFTSDTGDLWLHFELELDQIIKKSQVFHVLQSNNFDQTIDFDEQFRSIRVYEKNGDMLSEIQTKYIEDIYDPLTKTAVIKVLENSVNVFIPNIYRLTNEILILVESTNGLVDIDYYRYVNTNFTYTLKDLKKDLLPSDEAFNILVVNISSRGRVTGGRDALSFTELRERIINNTIGVNKIPITQRQVLSNVTLIDFDSYRTVDSLTGRIYVVSSDIPLYDNTHFSTEVNVTFINLTTTVEKLRELPTVLDNMTGITILPETMYEVKGLAVSIVDNSDVSMWHSLQNGDKLEVEQKNWRTSPFFYVVNYARQLVETRVYQLDNPKIVVIDHIANNHSTNLFISSKNVLVRYNKDNHNYSIFVELKSDAELNILPLSEVWGQVVFTGDHENYHVDMIDSDREDDIITMEFTLETNLDVWGERMKFTNFTDEQGIQHSLDLNLLAELQLVYGTVSIPSNYSNSDISDIVYQDINLAHKYPLTHERLHIRFGTELTYLWRDSRLLKSTEYERWDRDIPAIYEKTTVPYDPDNGIIPFGLDDECRLTYPAARKKGDTITDSDGNIIWKYRKGDLKRDLNNALIPLQTDHRNLSMDILCFNGIIDFITTEETLDIITQVKEFIIRQSTKDIIPLLDKTLENTQLLYKPKSSLGLVQVGTTDGNSIWIDKEQKFIVNVLVSKNVYGNEAIRSRIKEGITITLSNSIQKLTVSYSTLVNDIRDALGELVIAVSVTGFGGVDDKELTVTLLDAGDTLSIAKKLILDQQLDVTQVEDLEVHFSRHQDQEDHNELR